MDVRWVDEGKVHVGILERYKSDRTMRPFGRVFTINFVKFDFTIYFVKLIFTILFMFFILKKGQKTCLVLVVFLQF